MSKQDKSPKILQRDKFKEELKIKELNWTEKQKEFINIALNKDVKMMFISGPAGSSKTLLSIYCALQLIKDKRVSDIMYIRSPVESSDSKIGYLPGDADEKLKYYNLPFADKLDELLSKQYIEALNNQGRLQSHPLSFVRGMSWNCKAIILDEAQNCTQKEIVTLMTRVGEFSKCFILADPDQSDLGNGKSGGFEKLQSIFNDQESQEKGIYSFYFTEDDIKRSDLVKFIVKKLKALSPSSRV
jgi:phosphate starvation-inducible PhoH-like protein